MKKVLPLFFSGVFLSLNYAAILYINSSYLGKFFKPETVSTLFLIGALGNILLLFNGSRLLRIFGGKGLLLIFMGITTLSTVALGFGGHAPIIAIAFVVYSSIISMASWSLDLLLEEVTTDANTGSIRGAYLTSINAAVAVAPLFLAIFANNDDLRPLYLTATLLIIPPMLVSIFFVKQKRIVNKGPVSKLPFRLWLQRKNIRRITIARFILEFFYTFMVIYTPVYLHDYLGFDWRELGFMFTIMLLPFVIFEWPAGELGDKRLGEKEILILGFLIMIGTLLYMPNIGKVYIVWTFVLFLSRVGASLVEIATESYFFKKVNSEDTGLISIFRLSRPISIIVAAVVGAISLNLFSFEKIFLVLAGFVVLGLLMNIKLVDTK